MNILVIPAGYPSLENPNIGIFIKKKYEDIKENNDNITIINAPNLSLSKWWKRNLYKISEYTDTVGAVIERGTRAFMTATFPSIAVKRYTNNIKELIELAISKYGKPDVVVSHFSLPSGFATMNLFEQSGIPIIIVEHHHLLCSNKLKNSIVERLTDELSNSAAFICGSNYLKNSIEGKTGLYGKIIVINNRLKADDFFYTPIRYNADKESFLFFSAGNLKKIKNFDLLIRAFNTTFGSNDRACLYIAGDGEEREQIEMLIKRLNCQGSIKLLGSLNQEGMYDWYKKCHAFILLSETETFGNVYREAMAVGRPVISSHNGGIMENWTNDCGILTDINNSDEISTAMQSMIENYEKYDQKYISVKCISDYSYENTSGKFRSILLRQLNEYTRC